MDHIAAVRAALKAAAPVVAIPVEGRAPVCINARLLKGALKGVTINFVKVLENGSLQVIGADMNNRGFVRTSSTFAPMRRDEALKQIREWTSRLSIRESCPLPSNGRLSWRRRRRRALPS